MTSSTRVGYPLRAVLAIALIAMFASLGRHLWVILAGAPAAITAFGGRDYGEGIVWQQAADLFTAKAFGPIDGFSAIVYHYPPLYHAVTWVGSHAFGADMLGTGRFLSLSATLIAALFAGLIARQACARPSAGVGAIVVLGAFASAFAFFPVALWAPLMRVDMLAAMFSLAGVLFSIHALRHPRLIHVAALAFVAAVYTKQTAIAAPVAVFGVLLWLRPRLAFAGFATAVATGLAVLAGLMFLTEGRFAKHILLYNINRFEVNRLGAIAQHVASHFWIFAGALVGLVVRLRSIAADLGGLSPARRKERLAKHPADAAFVIAAACFFVTGVMTLTVAKSGSYVNYFIEWSFALAVLMGIGLIEPARMLMHGDRSPAMGPALAVVVICMFAVHGSVMTPTGFRSAAPPLREAQLRMLSSRVGQATKPVISDEMVIVRRAGKDVVFEPAIFAELAHTGVWDEKPFVEMINRREFAFFVTNGSRGHPMFDSRYNPPVADAMEAHYPIKRTLAGYTIHLPKD